MLSSQEQMDIIKTALSRGYKGPISQLIEQAIIERGNVIQKDPETPEAPTPSLGGKISGDQPTSSTERNIIKPGQYRDGGVNENVVSYDDEVYGPAQNKDIAIYGSPEYAKAYEEGRLLYRNQDPTSDAFAVKVLPEVNITWDKELDQDILKKYPYFNKLSEQQKKYFRDDSVLGRGVRSSAMYGDKWMDSFEKAGKGFLTLPITGAGEVLSTPASVLTEGVAAIKGDDYNFKNALPTFGTSTNNQRFLSDLSGIGYDNPEGFWQNAANFGLDISGDPFVATSLLKTGFKGINKLSKIPTSFQKNITTPNNLKTQTFTPNLSFKQKQLDNTTFVRHTSPELSPNILKPIDLTKKHTGKGERNLVWFGKGDGAAGYNYPGRETFNANLNFNKPIQFSTNKVFKNKELDDLLNKGHDMVIMGKGDAAHYMPLNKNTIRNLKKTNNNISGNTSLSDIDPVKTLNAKDLNKFNKNAEKSMVQAGIDDAIDFKTINFESKLNQQKLDLLPANQAENIRKTYFRNKDLDIKPYASSERTAGTYGQSGQFSFQTNLGDTRLVGDPSAIAAKYGDDWKNLGPALQHEIIDASRFTIPKIDPIPRYSRVYTGSLTKNRSFDDIYKKSKETAYHEQGHSTDLPKWATSGSPSSSTGNLDLNYFGGRNQLGAITQEGVINPLSIRGLNNPVSRFSLTKNYKGKFNQPHSDQGFIVRDGKKIFAKDFEKVDMHSNLFSKVKDKVFPSKKTRTLNMLANSPSTNYKNYLEYISSPEEVLARMQGFKAKHNLGADLYNTIDIKTAGNLYKKLKKDDPNYWSIFKDEKSFQKTFNKTHYKKGGFKKRKCKYGCW